MSKEAFNPYIAQVKREHFVQKAVTEGVLEIIKTSERSQNIGILSSISEMSYKKIGAIYPNAKTGEPLERERVRQISKKFLKNSYKASSAKLQNTYSLQEILSRRLFSLKEDCSPAKVKTAMEKGNTDLKQLRKETGIRNFMAARKSLQKRCIKVPLFQSYAGFAEKVRKENDYKKLQEILDSHPDGSFQGYLNNHRKDKEKVLANLLLVARSAGLHLRSKDLSLISESIEKNKITKGLPKRIIDAHNGGRYTVILSKHKNIVINVLQSDPELEKFKKNPVQQVCGKPVEKIPSTGELLKKDKFARVIKIMHTVGHKITRKKGETNDIYLINCPVPIFRMVAWGGIFYPIGSSEQLKEFFKLQKGKA